MTSAEGQQKSKSKKRKQMAEATVFNADNLLALQEDLQELAMMDPDVAAAEMRLDGFTKSFNTKSKMIPDIPCPSCDLRPLVVTGGGLGTARERVITCANCKHTFRLYDTMGDAELIDNTGKTVPGLTVSEDESMINWGGVNYIIQPNPEDWVEEIAMMDQFANEQNDDESPGESTTLDYIMDELIPEFDLQFRGKHRDYGDGAATLGTAGQFADIYRKVTKLKRSLWEHQTLSGEQPREVLMDLIGHCFLTIDMLDREQQ